MLVIFDPYCKRSFGVIDIMSEHLSAVERPRVHIFGHALAARAGHAWPGVPARGRDEPPDGAGPGRPISGRVSRLRINPSPFTHDRAAKGGFHGAVTHEGERIESLVHQPGTNRIQGRHRLDLRPTTRSGDPVHTAPVRHIVHVVRAGSIALVVAIGLTAVQGPAGSVGVGPGVPIAQAADGFTESGSTTYTLEPAKGRLAVKVTLKITNKTPDTTEPYECTKYREDWFWGTVPYTDTCYRTTRWYRDSASVWVEREAGKIKATSGGKKLVVETSRRGDGYRLETIRFPKLFNGKSRTITITYTLKGGAPRSDSSTRTLRAYASFCVIANGADRGDVAVRLPSGFKVETTGEALKGKVSGGTRVFTSGAVKDTARWYACLSGTNEDGYAAETMTAPDGRTVRLLSWPEDTAWSRGVRDEVATGLPELRRVVGADMAGTDALIVKEASTGTEYAGFYDRKSNTITVGEDYTQPSLVAHELAHVWFNGSAFAETWMSEGYAEWAGRAASGGVEACGRPGAAAASVKLADWQYLEPRSTSEERERVAAQYDAACHIVTAVAQAAGEDRMTAATGALLGRLDPYAAAAGAGAGAGAGATGARVPARRVARARVRRARRRSQPGATGSTPSTSSAFDRPVPPSRWPRTCWSSTA